MKELCRFMLSSDGYIFSEYPNGDGSCLGHIEWLKVDEVEWVGRDMGEVLFLYPRLVGPLGCGHTTHTVADLETPDYYIWFRWPGWKTTGGGGSVVKALRKAGINHDTVSWIEENM